MVAPIEITTRLGRARDVYKRKESVRMSSWNPDSWTDPQDQFKQCLAASKDANPGVSLSRTHLPFEARTTRSGSTYHLNPECPSLTRVDKWGYPTRSFTKMAGASAIERQCCKSCLKSFASDLKVRNLLASARAQQGLAMALEGLNLIRKNTASGLPRISHGLELLELGLSDTKVWDATVRAAFVAERDRVIQERDLLSDEIGEVADRAQTAMVWLAALAYRGPGTVASAPAATHVVRKAPPRNQGKASPLVELYMRIHQGLYYNMRTTSVTGNIDDWITKAVDGGSARIDNLPTDLAPFVSTMGDHPDSAAWLHDVWSKSARQELDECWQLWHERMQQALTVPIPPVQVKVTSLPESATNGDMFRTIANTFGMTWSPDQRSGSVTVPLGVAQMLHSIAARSDSASIKMTVTPTGSAAAVAMVRAAMEMAKLQAEHSDLHSWVAAYAVALDAAGTDGYELVCDLPDDLRFMPGVNDV